MSRTLCLIRNCLGLTVRIELAARPLAGEQGLWTLLFAAGLSGAQPSSVKAQGPFRGPVAAERVLDEVASTLAGVGYQECSDPLIWCLHLQAELRRLNGPRRCRPEGRESQPEV
ncbi:hypothetical protein HA520_05405 [Azotobacter chroococcum]|jgi:hypothetical protein|uniref:Uncharacterized protein n=2 Tax=Azotobacter chroococcum TaxID=353 RepID=A0A0C4WK17_9GAMM|nr:hypothetical protein [Azotobacter chroococcum]OHC12026.1 MAG: hypothetical protein A2002_11930 [Pseudomonadales bacterium GWC1_66_9]AJE20439.1 Hypothetical protein Achr_9570 [Azotobacter chroococcum NCIMB 8003]MEE4463788.1 hypothetical protein [Azotobacter chroococcum]NHN76725.1 hypothetical protein [Azotobacter chroococcum]TBW06564.1 hypothetical protein E0E50_20710 [Azotobacter chroococcum subsp. isscasi]